MAMPVVALVPITLNVVNRRYVSQSVFLQKTEFSLEDERKMRFVHICTFRRQNKHCPIKLTCR